MTPHQRAALLAAAESGDDVRAVTLALQIAAGMARANRRDEAMAITRLVDHIRRPDVAEREHRRMRLDIAARMSPPAQSAELAVEWADKLIAANDEAPVPGAP